jgi:hypothetical protein
MSSHRGCAELLNVGTDLIAALSEEASLAARHKRRPGDKLLALDWAQARSRVDECGERYFAMLETLGYPNHKIRNLLEV